MFPGKPAGDQLQHRRYPFFQLIVRRFESILQDKELTGRDTVRAFRETPRRKPRSKTAGWLASVPVILAGLAVGSAAYFLTASRFHFFAPQTVNLAGLSLAERTVCSAEADAAARDARHPDPMMGEVLPINLPTRRAELAEAGAVVKCLAAMRPQRLCETHARAAFVSTVRAYVARADKLWRVTNDNLATVTTGAPSINVTVAMNSLGLTMALVKLNNREVDETLTGLISEGYLHAGAFDSWLSVVGLESSTTLNEMLADVAPGVSKCA